MLNNQASLFEHCRELLNENMYAITNMDHTDLVWLANEFMHVPRVEGGLFNNKHWLAQLKSWNTEVLIYREHCYNNGVIAYDIENSPWDLYEAVIAFGIEQLFRSSDVLSVILDRRGSILLDNDDVTAFLNELNSSNSSRISM